jgi:hypothetical protein
MDNVEPIAVTVRRACELSGLGPTKLWDLIAKGELQTTSIGRRRLVLYKSLQRLLQPVDHTTHQAPRGRGRPPKSNRVEATPSLS